MPCTRITPAQRAAAVERARRRLEAAEARITKTMDGGITIDGMSEEEKNGMNDACVLAGLAKVAGTDIDLAAKLQQATGQTPAEIITGHGHSH